MHEDCLARSFLDMKKIREGARAKRLCVSYYLSKKLLSLNTCASNIPHDIWTSSADEVAQMAHQSRSGLNHNAIGWYLGSVYLRAKERTSQEMIDF